jgi:hypothetical protein
MLRHPVSRPASVLALRQSPLAPNPTLPTPPKTLLVIPLSATFTNSSASVASKRLTPKLTPLDATLTKNTGGEGESPGRRRLFLVTRHSSLATSSRRANSFPFNLFHTLLRFFALSKNPTPFLSCESTLLPKNTQGGGTLPSSSLPLSFFALPAVNCQLSAVSSIHLDPHNSPTPIRSGPPPHGSRNTGHGTRLPCCSPLATSLLNSCPSLTRSHHV